LPGNGCDQRPTRKTSSRKLSSSSGGETTKSTIARCFTLRFARSHWILSGVKVDEPAAKPLQRPKAKNLRNHNLNLRTTRNGSLPRQSTVFRENNARWSS